jgi:hypothetical protein
MAAPGGTVHSTRRGARSVEVCQCSEKSSVFSARLYAGLPVQDLGIAPWSPSRRGSPAASGDRLRLELDASGRRVEGDRQTLVQPRLGPEAELFGGVTRVSDRHTHLANARRPAIGD